MKGGAMVSLEELRAKIDELDDEILRLLGERMAWVRKIGELKNSQGSPIYRPAREREILGRLGARGELPRAGLEAIYAEIFSLARNLEQPQRVAYLGPEGTYTHQAARIIFGGSSRYTPLAGIEEVFRELENGAGDFGVVPIENNTEGAVGLTLDCLARYEGLKIFGELYLDIHHCLAGKNEDLGALRRLYSHPQGMNQCRGFLEAHGLRLEFIPTKSTAQAAEMAAGDELGVAICSVIAAKIHALPVIFEKIEDNAANRTRFLILSRLKNEKTPRSKTSILAHSAHRPGALSELLEDFKRENINLTKLESRPKKIKDFVQSFYIDFEGHIEDEGVGRILAKHPDIIWLGSYPNGEKNGGENDL